LGKAAASGGVAGLRIFLRSEDSLYKFSSGSVFRLNPFRRDAFGALKKQSITFCLVLDDRPDRVSGSPFDDRAFEGGAIAACGQFNDSGRFIDYKGEFVGW
jgi:hypothetical protein